MRSQLPEPGAQPQSIDALLERQRHQAHRTVRRVRIWLLVVSVLLGAWAALILLKAGHRGWGQAVLVAVLVGLLILNWLVWRTLRDSGA